LNNFKFVFFYFEQFKSEKIIYLNNFEIWTIRIWIKFTNSKQIKKSELLQKHERVAKKNVNKKREKKELQEEKLPGPAQHSVHAGVSAAPDAEGVV
jgi:hypothetical protein